MDIRIQKSILKDFTISAPPSKSFTHRAYAIGALTKGSSTINNPLRADDTDSTLEVCRIFGAKIEEKETSIRIEGTGGRLEEPDDDIFVGNSGTTIRFFTSIAALNGYSVLYGDESVNKRPMQPLIDALSQLGVRTRSIEDDGTPPIEVLGGGIKGIKARIRGDISSQFISALLIACPYADKPVTISLTTPLKSKPYVDVTLDIMKHFGVRVDNRGYRHFKIPTKSFKPSDYNVEGDYSSASYFMALAAIMKIKAMITNLNQGSFQGDKLIIDILKRMGAGIQFKKDTIVICGDSLKGIQVDLGDTPDLLPTVALLACTAKGITRIENIEHARFKESDRVRACAKEFSRFGPLIEEGKDYLEITGTKDLKGGKVNSYSDHRMVMSLSILGTIAEGETVINGAESINISYPGFFEDLKRIGARVVT